MKLSQQPPKFAEPAFAAVMQFVDAEISKIVADIAATTPHRPSRTRRGARSKGSRHHKHAA